MIEGYREEKNKIVNQITVFRRESQIIDDKLQYRQISDIEWLRQSKRIDREVEKIEGRA